jgi:ferredoxin, 2Fe-2S
MPKITFVSAHGTSHQVEAPSGTSLMQAATDNGVPGIDGDCGGNCACATCHIYVDPAWSERTGMRTPTEDDMLNLVSEIRSNSRLACRITIDDSLDGLVIGLPESQH